MLSCTGASASSPRSAERRSAGRRSATHPPFIEDLGARLRRSAAGGALTCRYTPCIEVRTTLDPFAMNQSVIFLLEMLSLYRRIGIPYEYHFEVAPA